MRRTPSLVGLLSLIGLLVACLATRSLSQEARSQDDSEADLRSFAALRQRLTTVEQTQPAQAVAQYRQFVTAHPHLDPATAILVADTMAQLLYNRVRDVAAALAAYQETYARYQAAPSSLSLLTEQAKLLIAEARASEAQALVEAHWNATLRAEPALSSALLLQYARALKQQGKHDELITGLETALMASPALLDDGAQSQPRPGSPGSDAALLNGLGWGWMYAQLVDELLARGRVEEALSWAKVRFVTCSIQNGATDRAARMWAKVWTVKDPSQVTAQACVRAQQDPLAPNPLVMVVLPLGEERVRRGATSPSAATLSPAALSNVALLSTDPNQSGSSQAASDLVTSAHRTISLHLVRGAYVPAMVAACQLLAAQPDAPDGVLEVARVFKAVDLNLKRSNAFIAFFKTGQGDNPLQDFFRNQPPPAGQLPAAARSVTQLAGQGNPVFGTDELAITVPFLISQLRAGTMKAEAAWQTGVLTPDEVAYMLTWGGIVDGEGQIENKKLRTNLAGLLVRRAPRLAQPTANNQNLLLAVGDYYRSLKDQRAVAVYSRLMEQGKPPTDRQGRWQWEQRAWYYEPALNRLAQFYSETGNPGRAQQIWLEEERGVKGADAIASSVAALEAARLGQLMGDEQKAQELYARAAQYGYGWTAGLARWDRADALVKAGQHEAARQLLMQPLTGEGADKAKVGLLALLGYSYYRTEEFAAARKACAQAVAQYEASDIKPGRGIEYQAQQAKDTVRWMDQWAKSPLVCEPQQIKLTLNAQANSVKSLTRLVRLRTYRKMALTAQAEPGIKVQIVGEPKETAFFTEQELEVEVESPLLERGGQVALSLSNPGWDKAVQIPVVVEVPTAQRPQQQEPVQDTAKRSNIAGQSRQEK